MINSIENIGNLNREIREVILGERPLKISYELSNPDLKIMKKHEDDIELLNPSQKKAVTAIIRNKVVLIRGPPGTGKSRMSSLALKVLLTKLRGQVSENKKYKILVCADSNKAVDRLTTLMLEDDLKIVRVVGRNYFKTGEYLKADSILQEAILDPSNMAGYWDYNMDSRIKIMK